MGVNIQNFTTTEGAAAQITVPVTTITALVQDEDTQATIADYTGANALRWPEVLAALTPTQRAQLLSTIAQAVVLARAGV